MAHSPFSLSPGPAPPRAQRRPIHPARSPASARALAPAWRSAQTNPHGPLPQPARDAPPLTARAHASGSSPSSRNGRARHAVFPGEAPHARRARQGRRRPISSTRDPPAPHLSTAATRAPNPKSVALAQLRRADLPCAAVASLLRHTPGFPEPCSSLAPFPGTSPSSLAPIRATTAPEFNPRPPPVSCSAIAIPHRRSAPDRPDLRVSLTGTPGAEPRSPEVGRRPTVGPPRAPLLLAARVRRRAPAPDSPIDPPPW